jgi:hypothetical protein
MGGQESHAAETYALYRDPNILPCVLDLLDPTSLGLAACVCKKWRAVALSIHARRTDHLRRITVDLFRDKPDVLLFMLGREQKFRIVIADVIEKPRLFAWLVHHFGARAGTLPSRPIDLRVRACVLAAERGARCSLQWIIRSQLLPGASYNKKIFTAAAKGGDIRLLAWLLRGGFSWDRKACLEAASKSLDPGRNQRVAAWITANMHD